MERNDLILKYGEPRHPISNGDVLKIYEDTRKMPFITSAVWLLEWTGHQVQAKPLSSRILRLSKKASKFRDERLRQFLDEFIINTTITTLPPTEQRDTNTPPPPAQTPVRNDSTPSATPASILSPMPSTSRHHHRRTPSKRRNALRSDIARYERKLGVLERKLNDVREKLDAQERKKDHYGMRNVRRREERNVFIRKMLRKEKNEQMKTVAALKCADGQMKRKLVQAGLKIRNLERTAARRKTKLKDVLMRQRLLEKRAAYCHKMHQGRQECTDDDDMDSDESGRKVKETKSAGEYSDDVRFCVMGLAGLEVATGKIGQVMEMVSGLCKTKLSNLPSKTACQRIIDEGHVLAKKFIKEKVKKCKYFGIHKDGTTRRKVRILDTSVRTDEGESFCLGWSSVSAETGKAIADEAKDKLEEVVGESGLIDAVKKLKYMMNDRAANEKKSSRLLEEWKEECLKECDEEGTGKVHHLLCMAHVLLGFHTNVMKGIKKLDDYLSEDAKHPVVILLRDASDLFGPAGDYRGVRNIWEAYCMEKNIKSTIKNYKDNRFNGLFEVAAQIYHHHQDFIFILSSLRSKNAKQNRCFNSLQDDKLILLLESLGLFFHKITGPFWSLVISPKSTYQHFETTLRKLLSSLQKCLQNPNHFFDPATFNFFKTAATSTETKESLGSNMKDGMEGIIITICEGIITTLQTQLADFMDGGDYQDDRSIQSIPPNAPLTNLVSERHFGHLDSSQKRRPSSSLHHHSSVILLKQTRKGLRRWYNSLSLEEKSGAWRDARQLGKKLRRKHNESDKTAVMESMTKLKPKEALNETMVMNVGDLKEGQWIAVACEDAWYPALVRAESQEGQLIDVSFGELGKGLGVFKWPKGKDVGMISRRSVIQMDLDVQPRAGGRSWFVKDAERIQEKFKLF